MNIAKTFTAVGSGGVLPVDHNKEFGYTVSGSFVGTVVLESSKNVGQSWEVVTTITASRGGVLLSEFRQGGTKRYRFRCSAFTSGSIITSLTDSAATVGPSAAVLKLKSALANVSAVAVANKKIMSSPPTMTQQTAFVQPDGFTVPIVNPQVIAVNTLAMPNSAGAISIDPRIEVVPGALTTIGIGNLGYNDGSKFDFMTSYLTVGGSPGHHGLVTTRFMTNSNYFALGFCATIDVAVRIDGEYAAPTYKTYTVAGSTRFYVTFDFAGVKKPRLIEVFTAQGFGIGSIAIGQFDSLWAAPKNPISIVADGDSYLQGNSFSFFTGAFAEVAAAANAAYCANPVGGTGYFQANGSYPNALTRISQVTAAHGGESDVVLLGLGINDPKDSSPNATIANYFKTLRAALPKSLFIVLGPWCPTETNGTLFRTTPGAAIFAAVRAAGGAYILIDNIAGTYETSWGTSGSIGGKPWQTGTMMTLVGAAGVKISSISRTTNVVTVNTETAHGLTTNDTGVIYDSGSFNAQAVATVVTTTQFTYPQTGANETGTTLGTAGKLLVVGTGNGNQFSNGDGSHGNKDMSQYLAQRTLDAVKTAVNTYT